MAVILCIPHTSNDPLPVNVSDGGNVIAVECKAVFDKSNYMVDSLIEVNIYLRSSAPLSLNMSKLAILFMEEVSQSGHSHS